MNLSVRKLTSLFCLTAGACLLTFSPAPAQTPKAPKWAYAFDLACRKYKEAEFTKDTKKYGVEVFLDANNGMGVYICQTGNIGLAGKFGVTPPVRNAKAPTWTAGLDLKARKAGEKDFTDQTKTYGLEVFYDTEANNWIYISENGNIGVASGKNTAAGSLEAPEWLHSYDLKCRKGGRKKFDDKDANTYGIEVYKDRNNGNLIYICQTGSVAIVPGGDDAKPGDKGPEWLHGQDLQCRKYGETTFGKDTKKFGLEIFRDGNNGNLIFISETGHIAVTPGPDGIKTPTENPKDAKFSHGLDLSARQAGEKNFTPTTKTYAMEVFNEPNVNATLYICETGAIAAVASKK